MQWGGCICNLLELPSGSEDSGETGRILGRNEHNPRAVSLLQLGSFNSQQLTGLVIKWNYAATWASREHAATSVSLAIKRGILLCANKQSSVNL